MAKRAERSTAKEQYWREVIDGWSRSGGSVRRWCTQRQISEPSFYSWRRTLAERDAAAAPMPSVRRRARRKRWVEQQLAPALRPGDIVVMDNLSSHKVAGVRD